MSKKIISLILVFVMLFSVLPQNLAFSNEFDASTDVGLVLGEITPIQSLTNDTHTAYSFGDATFSEEGIVSKDGGYFTVSVDFGTVQMNSNAVLNNVSSVTSLSMGENQIAMTSSTALSFNINPQTTYDDIENTIESMEFIIDGDITQNVSVEVVKGISLEDEMSPLKTQNGKQYRYFAEQDGMTYEESTVFATSESGLLASPDAEPEVKEISGLFDEYKHLDEDNVEHLSFFNVEDVLLEEDYAVFDKDGYTIVDENYLEDGVIVEYEPNKFETISMFEMVTKDNVLSKMTKGSTRAVESFYVSNTGLDTNDGRTPATPFATIDKAVDSAATDGLTNTTIYLLTDINLNSLYGNTNGAIELQGAPSNGKNIVVTSSTPTPVTIKRITAFEASMISVGDTNSTIKFSNIIFDGNSMSPLDKDAFMTISNSGTVIFDKCKIINQFQNSATRSILWMGGSNNVNLTMNNTYVEDCLSNGFGFMFTCGVVKITNSTFKDNTTEYVFMGQNSYIATGATLQFTMSNSLIQNNHVDNNAPVDPPSANKDNNQEWKHAFMVLHFDSVVAMNNVTFDGNSAIDGPLINVLDGNLNMKDCTITNNTANSIIQLKQDATRFAKVRLAGTPAKGVTITNNHISSTNGTEGYAVNNLSDHFYVAGKVIIADNANAAELAQNKKRNVYLPEGRTIKMSTIPSWGITDFTGSKIGVTVEDTVSQHYPTVPSDSDVPIAIEAADYSLVGGTVPTFGYPPLPDDYVCFVDDHGTPKTAILKMDTTNRIVLSTSDGTYYVKNARQPGDPAGVYGNDTTGNGTYEFPYETINRAFNAISTNTNITTTNGATIYVMGNTPNGVGGTYTMYSPASYYDHVGGAIDYDYPPQKMTITSTNLGTNGDHAVPSANRVTALRDPSFNTQIMFQAYNAGSTMIFNDIIVDGNNVALPGSTTAAFDAVDSEIILDNVLVQNHNLSGYNSRVFCGYTNTSSIVVKNSEIKNNNGIGAAGGNVFLPVNNSALTIENTKVTNNTNVYNIIDSWGSETINITGSEFSDNNGAFNMFQLETSNFTVENTIVTDNSVNNVFNIKNNATVNLKDKTNISNNLVTGYAITGPQDNLPNSTIKVEGEVYVYDNNVLGSNPPVPHNIYLDNSESIKLTGPLAANSNIGVSLPPSVAGLTTGTYPNDAGEKFLVAEKFQPTGHIPTSTDMQYFKDDRIPPTANKELILDSGEDKVFFTAYDNNNGKYYVKSTGTATLPMDENDGSPQNPFGSINDAVAAIVASTNSADLDADGATIYVMDDVTISTEVALLAANRNITITTTDVDYLPGNPPSYPPHTGTVNITRASGYTGTMFKLDDANASLTFKDINVNGGDIAAATGKPAFDVVSGKMSLDNVLVSDHKSAAGSSVFDVASSGELNITNSSKIIDNDNGVSVINVDGGTLNISATDIKNNTHKNVIDMNAMSKVNLDGSVTPVNITDNPLSSGYAVNVAGNNFVIKGNIQINNNLDGTVQKNVYLSTGSEIKLAAPITGSSIGVTHQSPPSSKISDKVVIVEEMAPTPGYAPLLVDESIFFEDVNSINLLVKWYDSTPSGDGKIYLEYIWDAAPPTISVESAGYTEAVGQPIIGNQVSVTAVAPIDEPSPINGILTYQWYVSATQSNSSGSSGTLASGMSTNAAYTLSNPSVNTTSSEDWYYCVVTNTNTNATGATVATSISNPVQIKLTKDAETPTVTTTGDITTIVGTTETITATATISDGGSLSYQWYECNDATGSSPQPISGATSATFSTPTSTIGTYYYIIETTNTNPSAIGNPTATRTSSVVTVDVSSNIVNAATPSISNIFDISIPQNNPASLTVNATSPDGGTLSYAWYTCGENGNNAAPIGGATSVTYSPSTNDIGNFYYKVEVNNHNNVTGIDDATAFSNVVRVRVVPPMPTAPSPEIEENGNGNINEGTNGENNIDSAGGNEDEIIIIPLDDTPHGSIADISGISRYLNDKDHFAYLTGYEDGTFEPDAYMTRAEVAQTFYNLLLDKNPSITNSVQYTDVPDDAWYAEAVNTLAGIGIITGYPDGSFKPNEPVTRAEFVTMASQFAYSKKGSSGFTDVPADYWAYDEITTAVGYGCVTGYEDGTFRPDQPITRAEAVTIVNNMLGRHADSNYISDNEVYSFSDVESSHWAYWEITEATVTHDQEIVKGTETWTQSY